MNKLNPCVTCKYARMRKDICGIYCVGEFHKREDGTCEKWVHYKRRVNNETDRR